MERIPKEVDEVLAKVQEIDKDAIIVGGFLRDLVHGKEPKDIDIVVGFDTNGAAICHDLKGYNWDCNTIESSQQDVNFSYEASFNVADLSWPINIIGARQGQSPVEKLKSHDFGLCQIWYNGTTLRTTPEFDYDRAYKCMTLMRCNSLEEWDAVKTHYFRVARKYPYPMRISHDFMDKLFGKGFEDDLIPF